MIRDLGDAVAGRLLRVRTGFVDGVGAARPRRSDRAEACLTEKIDPRLPARGVDPEAVDEDNGGTHVSQAPSTRQRVMIAEKTIGATKKKRHVTIVTARKLSANPHVAMGIVARVA